MKRLLLAVMSAALIAGCTDAASNASLSVVPALPAHIVSGVKPTIVLVHGAWSDGSAWQDVIPLLERDGFHVIAVQNSMRSLAGDVASTRRVIEAQGGPVLAVGHSYGGVVITGAAAGNPNVTGLVYIAAYAPDDGEPFGALAGRFGPSAIDPALAPDAIGLLYVNRDKFRDVFAQDVRASTARVMAAAQTPLNYTVFGESVPQAAWHSIPSWFLISKDDQVIKPELAQFMATRIGARTFTIRSSHSSPVSRPYVVAAVIKAAANAGQR
jgi:pimeloyl-ACP methyl ester carboxylesterase